jgi:hypothetical protein
LPTLQSQAWGSNAEVGRDCQPGRLTPLGRRSARPCRGQPHEPAETIRAQGAAGVNQLPVGRSVWLPLESRRASPRDWYFAANACLRVWPGKRRIRCTASKRRRWTDPSRMSSSGNGLWRSVGALRKSRLPIHSMDCRNSSAHPLGHFCLECGHTCSCGTSSALLRFLMNRLRRSSFRFL